MNEQSRENRLIGRLLGPAGPELSCERCFEELDRYVELELSGADADAVIPGMRAHLAGCSACAEDHESLRAMLSERSS
jgi:anti-sigma factor RsiW